MFDSLPTNILAIISIGGLTFSIITMLGVYFAPNIKMVQAVAYLAHHIAYNSGNPVAALVMFANALSGRDRKTAISHLVELATLHNNTAAFLALRDSIDAKDLKRVLKTWGKGKPSSLIKGDVIGLRNARMLLCFLAGTRTQEHLASEITEAEHMTLRERFNVHRPLETAGQHSALS